MSGQDFQIALVGIVGMVSFCWLVVLWEEWRDRKRKQKGYDDWI